MRGKKAAINTVFSLLEEFVSVVCGFILPRLILSAFGSKYNGLTTSISQFLSCAVLLRSGIGGATRAALYKPLANHDQGEINSIVKATDIFMKKIGLILGGSIIGFAAIYPFFVRNEFEWFFTFSLFLIIGASTFAESFFGITYLIVLQADQKLWVSSLLKCVCTILNTLIGSLLILGGFDIHFVKLGSALVYIVYPIILGTYVKHRYRIDLNVTPNNKAIEQRWDAFWQQVSLFVMNNTDVMVLTICSSILEVSVYSVYNMVIHGLKRVIVSFSNGIEAAFGNMIAKNEDKILKENVAVIENVQYGVSTVVFTCAGILILDFVRLYTHNITDIDYIRPAFAYLLILANFFNGIRMPYQMVVQAAGHYKQTKRGAMIEPILNICLSVLLVFKYGLIGVAAGTLVATLFRTVQYSSYMRRFLVRRSWIITVKRILASLVECVLIIGIVNTIGFGVPQNYGEWALQGFATGFISCVIVGVGSLVFFFSDSMMTWKKIRGAIMKRS